MKDNKNIYQIKLEDYCRPRYSSAIKGYYGTMEELIEFVLRLEDNEHASSRYHETIDAMEFYDLDNEVTHTMAGQTLPVLTPAQEVCRFETTLDNQYFNYQTASGAMYPCYISGADVCQTLICTAGGYERCIKASISNLRICNHGVGWMCANNLIKGFPGVITWDGEHHILTLAVSQEHYEFDELDIAMEDVVDRSKIDLSFVIADVVAEG